MNESALVKICILWLGYKRIFCYRQNSGAGITPSGRFIRYGKVGSPDIIAVIGGKYIGIECKIGKGRQSPSQIEFQEKLENAGGEYWIVRQLEDLEGIIKGREVK